MSAQPAVAEPRPSPWLALVGPTYRLYWYRDANHRDGCERVVLARLVDDRTLRMLAIEQTCVGTFIRPADEARYLRVAEAMDNASAIEKFREIAKRRGYNKLVAKELKLPPPPEPEPEIDPLTDKPKVNEGLIELYARAAKLLKVPQDELKKKYAHLNNGLQAMSLRNRLRGAGFQV